MDYGVEKLLGGVNDLLLPGILLGMLDHQEEEVSFNQFSRLSSRSFAAIADFALPA